YGWGASGSVREAALTLLQGGATLLAKDPTDAQDLSENRVRHASHGRACHTAASRSPGAGAGSLAGRGAARAVALPRAAARRPAQGGSCGELQGSGGRMPAGP